MPTKKIALMIYPYFSMQEVACLTSALTIWYEREVTVFASTKAAIRSEEGIQVLADKLLDEFAIDEYDCVILPGILNPMPALFDARNIAFLRALKGSDIVIASISSSPLLLGKAGLLTDRKYTGGVFEEVVQHLPYMPKPSIVREPICRDGNLITAVGFAFREFAVQTLRALGIDCPDTLFTGPKPEDTGENMIFRMGEAHFQEFLREYEEYERRHAEDGALGGERAGG